MKYPLFLLTLFFAACAENTPVSVIPDSTAPALPVSVRPAPVLETRIYFAQNTFPRNEVRAGMRPPYVTRILTETERLLLDSILNGHYNDIVPEAACYAPKHAIVEIDSGGSSKTVNICFACNRAQSGDERYKAVSIEAWQYFFQRIGWPVRDGYPEFFQRAQSDSVFRRRMGDFRF